MQWMSLSFLLRKRMSNEKLEEGDKWTQAGVQKITITITKKLDHAMDVTECITVEKNVKRNIGRGR